MAKNVEHTELLVAMRKNFNASVAAEQNMRSAGKRSNDFFVGKQWSDEDMKIRDDDGRPYYTFDKLSKFVYQLSGDMRQNMPQLKTIPVQNAGFDEAQIMNEVIRYIERNTAEDAKQTAALSQLSSGMGYWWYSVEDSKHEPNSKEIVVKRVSNRFTVYLDQTAELYTYEDGKYAFISDMMKRDEFKKEFPGKVLVDFETTALGDHSVDWHEDGHIRVVLYFYKEKKKTTIVKAFNPTTGETHNIKLTDDLTESDISRAGMIIVDSEEKELDRIMWIKASGVDVLEGPEEFPGDFIPIVPVIGHETFDDNLGVRGNKSLIEPAIPAQEAYNYATTKMIETIALSPLAPFMATAKQISENPQEWQGANRLNLAVLTHKPDSLAHGAPKRSEPPQASSALLTMAAQADNDIRDIIGRGLASLGQAQKERTGAAIEASKRSSDVTTYTFFSNFLKSVQFGGRIMLSMIPEVFNNERVIRIYGDDNEIQDLTINEVVRDVETGEVIVFNDLTQGKYDYMPVSTIGQLTKRLEMKQGLIDIMTIAPEKRDAFLPEYVEVADMPNKEAIKKKLRQLEQQPTQEQKGAPPQLGQTVV